MQQCRSWLAQLRADVIAQGTAMLAANLGSGEWDRRYGYLRQLDQLDVGYRLVTASGQP